MRKGTRHSKETRMKMIKNHKGMLGKHLSKETKLKISRASKLYRHSEKSKLKISRHRKGLASGKNHPMYGKHHTKEARLKMSKAVRKAFKEKGAPFLGRRHSKKSRLKMSQSASGRVGKNAPMYHKHHSEETKEKLRRAFKGSAYIRHHIYLKRNGDETIVITNSKHKQLHQLAYDYIYAAHGKRGVDNYIKWFNRKYGLKGVV